MTCGAACEPPVSELHLALGERAQHKVDDTGRAERLVQHGIRAGGIQP